MFPEGLRAQLSLQMCHSVRWDHEIRLTDGSQRPTNKRMKWHKYSDVFSDCVLNEENFSLRCPEHKVSLSRRVRSCSSSGGAAAHLFASKYFLTREDTSVRRARTVNPDTLYKKYYIYILFFLFFSIMCVCIRQNKLLTLVTRQQKRWQQKTFEGSGGTKHLHNWFNN